VSWLSDDGASIKADGPLNRRNIGPPTRRRNRRHPISLIDPELPELFLPGSCGAPVLIQQWRQTGAGSCWHSKSLEELVVPAGAHPGGGYGDRQPPTVRWWCENWCESWSESDSLKKDAWKYSLDIFCESMAWIEIGFYDFRFVIEAGRCQ
jgi:hypothetical protein